jgi:hypothetical protein
VIAELRTYYYYYCVRTISHVVCQREAMMLGRFVMLVNLNLTLHSPMMMASGVHRPFKFSSCLARSIYLSSMVVVVVVVVIAYYYSARVLRAKFLRPTRGMCTVPTWDHRDGFLLKNTTCYGGPLLGCRDAGKKS